MENQFLDWVAQTVRDHPSLRVGIGDDAAVLRWRPDSNIVVATDAITDQVDFRLDEVDPRLVGRKALAVNLSDLAAMAAEPMAALVTLILPKGGGANRSCGQLARDLILGMAPLAEQFDVAIAGGDTNTWDAPLAISVTVIGRTTQHGPLERSGAQIGDALLVTGSLGGSILRRQWNFEPRIDEALQLHADYKLHAAIDISDGLAIDASRLAAASGLGIGIELSSVPISDDAVELSQQTGRPPIEHALGDGEDFELLFTTGPNEATRLLQEQPLSTPITQIGHCLQQPGLWRLDGDAPPQPLETIGFQHVGDAD